MLKGFVKLFRWRCTLAGERSGTFTPMVIKRREVVIKNQRGRKSTSAAYLTRALLCWWFRKLPQSFFNAFSGWVKGQPINYAAEVNTASTIKKPVFASLSFSYLFSITIDLDFMINFVCRRFFLTWRFSFFQRHGTRKRCGVNPPVLYWAFVRFPFQRQYFDHQLHWFAKLNEQFLLL